MRLGIPLLVDLSQPLSPPLPPVPLDHVPGAGELPDVLYKSSPAWLATHLSIVPCFVSACHVWAVFFFVYVSVYVCVALDDSLVCRSIDTGP